MKEPWVVTLSIIEIGISYKSQYQQFTPPFDIPASWEWVTLDDLAFYKKGPFGSSLTKSMFVPNGKNTFKVFEQKNAIQKDASLGHYYISSEKFEELRGFEVHPNDIIVSCAGTIGETYVLPNDIERGIINQALMIIRLFDSNIQRFYLEYFDFVLKNNAVKEGKGTAIKNIPPFDILKSYPFPLPPIDEQNRIAKKLDTYFELIQFIDDSRLNLFTAISKAKSKILDLAMQGKLVPQDPADEPAADMLRRINPKARIITDNPHSWNIPNSWTWCQLGDIFHHNTGKTLSSSNRDGIEYEYITTSNVYWNRFELDDLKKMPFKENELEKCIVRHGDLLVCEGGDVGRSAIWNLDRNIMIQNHLHRLRPIANEIHTSLYYHVFRLYKYKDLIGGKGIALQGFSSKSLHQLVIPLPPANEQKHIVAKIEELYSVLDDIEASLRS